MPSAVRVASLQPPRRYLLWLSMASCTNQPSSLPQGSWQSWLRTRIGQNLRSHIVRNASWMLCGQGLQLVGRLAYFVIVARVLGPSGYGTFVACTALVATVAPFASCGTGNVMI